MIPLAQAWLSGENRSATRYDAELKRHLELPTVYNKYTTPTQLDTLAERIVFTNDIPSLLYEMEDNKQLTYSGILRTVKLPYDCFWLEYKAHTNDDPPNDVVYFGALVRKLINNKVRMLIVCGIHSEKIKGELACGIVYVVEYPHWPPMFEIQSGERAFSFEVYYSFNKHVMFSDRNQIYTKSAEDLSWVLTELIFGIFLVTQPKTYKDEKCKASDKLQRARVRSGKPALLEYRRINMHIRRKHTQYKRPQTPLQHSIRHSHDTDSSDAVQHRRYHKVMGHFRHYINTDNPRTIWIEPHYRGDPSLGVTFTERDVMR